MSVTAIHQLPRGFLWGCATAAHQVEGGNANDWWRWEKTAGHIFQNQQSGNACEWWRGRYIEDFDRAADMHNNAQRISVEWSRIEPEPGRWDVYSLARYKAMLKALRDRGMEPMVTLHHFTNPLWLGNDDGWLDDRVPEQFGRFVRKVVEVMGDQCSLWCTINEPLVYATLHFIFGNRPPGLKNRGAANRVLANMVRAHAIAYHAIKELQPHAQVGFANHNVNLKPTGGLPINQIAVKAVDSFLNNAFMLALRDGVLRVPGARSVSIPQAKGTLDWIGVQYYQEYEVGFDLRHPTSLFIHQQKPADSAASGVVTPPNWGGLNPAAIFRQIEKVYKLMKLPIYVTESGVPDPTDTIRLGYLVETVRAVWKAANFNYPVKGFFHWTLVDNFEWSEGYDPRFNFGLYKVDFQTQERTPRQSANLYREICRANGLSAEIVEKYTPQLLTKLFPGEQGLSEAKLKPGGNKPASENGVH